MKSFTCYLIIALCATSIYSHPLAFSGGSRRAVETSDSDTDDDTVEFLPRVPLRRPTFAYPYQPSSLDYPRPHFSLDFPKFDHRSYYPSSSGGGFGSGGFGSGGYGGSSFGSGGFGSSSFGDAFRDMEETIRQIKEELDKAVIVPPLPPSVDIGIAGGKTKNESTSTIEVIDGETFQVNKTVLQAGDPEHGEVVRVLVTVRKTSQDKPSEVPTPDTPDVDEVPRGDKVPVVVPLTPEVPEVPAEGPEMTETPESRFSTESPATDGGKTQPDADVTPKTSVTSAREPMTQQGNNRRSIDRENEIPVSVDVNDLKA